MGKYEVDPVKFYIPRPKTTERHRALSIFGIVNHAHEHNLRKFCWNTENHKESYIKYHLGLSKGFKIWSKEHMPKTKK